MIDTHRVLGRTRNTGYAFEGILPALVVARRRSDTVHVEKFQCAANQGLYKLTGWQLGHPLSTVRMGSDRLDPRWVGGIQNHAKEPLLRIDTTQHQIHAVLYARQYLWEE